MGRLEPISARFWEDAPADIAALFLRPSVYLTAVFLQPDGERHGIDGGLIVRTVLSARRRGQDKDDADHNHDQNKPRIGLPMGIFGALVSQEDA